jgi:SAM-dependent methyltransferase
VTTEDAIPAELSDFRGESFQKGHAAPNVDQELIALAFILDAQAALPSVQRLRDWSMGMLSPAPGDVAVDVGSGTGSEVRHFAGMVGTSGRAVGVEPHPGLRALAEDRSADSSGAGRAEFIDGDAMALPFTDATVDVLRCERVFQHLPDPAGAAREIARVLRPGGRAVVIDSDWASMVTRPGDPDVVRRMNDSMHGRIPNPFSGRDLRTHLQAAGLAVDPDIGSSAVMFPDAMLADPVMLRINAAQAVEEGAITADEAAALEAEVVAAAAVGEAFFSVTMYAVVARKPA